MFDLWWNTVGSEEIGEIIIPEAPKYLNKNADTEEFAKLLEKICRHVWGQAQPEPQEE